MFILLGAPIYKRAWLIDYWFEAIEKQSIELENLGFIFEAAPDDEETIEKLFSWYERHPQVRVFDVGINNSIPHVTHIEGSRLWTEDRYHHMAFLRNSLLARVRRHRPDRYFSLDTDILLENRDTLKKLYDLGNTMDVVSPLMFMTPVERDYPSVMTWVQAEPPVAIRMNPYPLGTVFQADIVMAAKMMTPKVYNTVDYVWHKQGEDLGWSHQLALSGFKAFCVSNIYCPHIMSPRHLQHYLQFGDDRALT